MATSSQAKSLTFDEGGVIALLILCVLASLIIAAKTHDPTMAFHAWLGLAAAGIGAFGAFLFSIFRKAMTLKVFYQVLLESATTTAMLFTVLIGALLAATESVFPLTICMALLAGSAVAAAFWTKTARS